MSSDDSADDLAPESDHGSVEADASTVHPRSEPTPDPLTALQKQVGEDPNLLEDAKTVIRDPSSRTDHSARLDRSPAAVAKVLQGKHLNHFLLEEMIGGGGMGAVFRAHDDQLDREVAIKVVPFVGGDAELQRRFRNEAQNAAKLDHPRIAKVFDVGHHDDWYYIVFEYVRGINIRDWVSRTGTMRIDDAVFYTCQVAEAIQHAANRRIVHRDIKPSNVLIDDDKLVKLVDMGLARNDKMEVDDATASGITLGTFDYISPEQARDPRAADLRSDIYSLGCTLYFMLTGQPPYPGGTMLQKLLSHGNSPPPDPRLIRKDVSAELAAVIEKMLAKNPAQRYQTATDLIADLRELAFREGLTRSKDVDAVTVSQPSRLGLWLERNAPVLVASTLLMLGVGWLQLMSAGARDEFNVARPTKFLEQIDTNVPQETSPSATGSSPFDSSGEPSLNAAEIAGNLSGQQGPSSRERSPADPPNLIVQAPDELNRTTVADGTGRVISDPDAFTCSRFCGKSKS